MQTRFSDSRRTFNESKKASISVLRRREKRTNTIKEFEVHEEKPTNKKSERLAVPVERCLLCDPDWCPTYKKRLCGGKQR